MIIDQLIRSKRKTIALIINRDGTLTVRAPLRASHKCILKFVQQKEEWIHNKQAYARTVYPKANAKTYVRGETFWYLGVQCPLEFVENLHLPVDVNTAVSRGLHLSNGIFYLSWTVLPRAPQLFKAWYRRQALLDIEERVRLFAGRCGLSYEKIKITSAQTRWGSCSAKGTLSFTWRLIMAPLQVIDYVVVHELVHTVEKNHRRGFWDKVKIILPDYKQQVKWMDIYGGLLRLD